MKKSLIAGVLLLVGMLVAFSAMVGFVHAQRDDVVITEEVVLGDRSAAEGLTIQLNNQWNDMLLWNTRLTFGEELDSETEFSFHPNGLKYEHSAEERVSIYADGGYGARGSGIYAMLQNSEMSYADVLIDVAKETEPGETLTKTVKLADYYSYFDLRMVMEDEEYSVFHIAGAEVSVSDMLTERLLVEIPENVLVEAKITKNAAGEVEGFDLSFVENVVDIWGGGTVLSDGCYFALSITDFVSGELIESDAAKRGIYKIPLQGKGNEAEVLWKEFDLVYPLAEMVLSMKADEKEEYLYVVSIKEDSLYLHRFQLETMELVQSVELGTADAQWTSCDLLEVTDKGILILTSNSQNVVYYLEKGTDELQLAVTIDTVNVDEIGTGRYWGGYMQDVVHEYQDGRLVLLWKQSTNDCWVLLADDRGVQYQACLRNSLGIGAEASVQFHKTIPYEIIEMK